VETEENRDKSSNGKIVILCVLTYVVSLELCWNLIGVVRFISQEV